MKILLTSTSFMDTPGIHKELLERQDWEVDTQRGPLTEDQLLPLIADYDAVICGDDDYTEQVLKAGYSGKLRILSKYGIGLDHIDLNTARKLGIQVANTPGVNHTTVAEHTFAHILAFSRNYVQEVEYVKNGQWKRITGHEISGKQLAIFGLGRIGKEVAIRAKAFGLKVKVFEPYPDKEFIERYDLIRVDTVAELVKDADIITIHAPLTAQTHRVFDKTIFSCFTKQPLLVNIARADIVDKDALVFALDNKLISGYLADVMWEEPMPQDEILIQYDNVFITPHIGSRTFENVARQGCAAIYNLIEMSNKTDR